MTPRARLTLGVVVGVFAAVLVIGAQTRDPLVGTWVLNVAKSKYTPGPGPRSATTVIEPAGSGYKFTVHQVPALGAEQKWTVTGTFDGKPAKITGNNPNGDSVTYTKVSATTYDSVTTMNGKETQRQHVVVSADGKIRTVTSTGTDAKGQKINNVAVYERK